MSKHVKQLVMDDLADRFRGQDEFVVVELTGVDAVTDNQFRHGLRQKGIHLMVVKNALARKVFGELGNEAVVPLLDGPSALVWGAEDIVSLTKELTEWVKKAAKLRIKGGASEGRMLSPEDVESLSKLPGREELIGRIMGQLLSPAGNLLGQLAEPAGRLVGQLDERGKGAEPEGAAEAEPSEQGESSGPGATVEDTEAAAPAGEAAS